MASRSIWAHRNQGAFDERIETALIGAVVGLAGRMSRAAIRRVARRAALRLPYYEVLWRNRSAWRRIAIHHEPELRRRINEGQGVILAPAHFGPYRWLAIELVARGYPVTLLIDPDNQASVDTDVRARMQQVFPDLDWGRFETVNSGEPTALWQLARALQRGRVVLMFADGNSGIDGRAGRRGALHLTFLGQTIRVRPGIAALAGTAGVALIPVFPHEHRRYPTFRLDQPIAREPEESKRAFRERAMRELYARLEREILARPGDWEEWWLLPQWLEGPPKVASSRQPQDKPLRVSGPALVGRKLVLLDAATWSLPVRGDVFDFANRHSLGRDPELVRLVWAAEQEMSARTWLTQQDDPSRAKQWLRELHRVGIVTARRS